MLQFYICDDEPRMLSEISSLVGAAIPDSNVTAFSLPEQLLMSLNNVACDILLLDIDMPNISGLELAKELSALHKKPLLVFVTSHDDLVYDSLQYHPFGFVRKSFLSAELPQVLRDCVMELEKKDTSFCFKTNSETVRVPISEIRYFESDGNYIKLIALSQEYRFRGIISAIENTLSDNGFVRIHKGFLVNQTAVNLLRADEVLIDNGAALPIGRTYAGAARQRLMRYMMT